MSVSVFTKMTEVGKGFSIASDNEHRFVCAAGCGLFKSKRWLGTTTLNATTEADSHRLKH